MKLYDDNGYLNIDEILKCDMPFNFIVGGRGTGKTFGALKYVIEHNIKFIFIRRMQSQVDLVNKPEFCPFKALNMEYGWDIGTSALSKYNVGFYNMKKNDNGKMVAEGKVLGYSMALSTVSNLRGFDASDVDLNIFDEFIPERHEKAIKNEGSAFLNMYETINRNRELQGRKPCKVLCLANANDLGNPIFIELKLVAKAEDMRRKNQEYSLLSKRGIGVFILNASPISSAKKDTALYKLSEGSEFEEMALANNFEELSSRSIKSMPIQEYNPIVQFGELCIYKHKSNNGLYATTHVVGSPMFYGTSDTERSRAFRKYQWIWYEYLKDGIIFENSTCEILLTKYFN